jgi:transposase
MNLKAIVIYLREDKHQSYEAIVNYQNDIYKIHLSEATIKNIINKAEKSEVLLNFEEAARASLIMSDRCNADVTAISVSGKNNWAHILCNSIFTLIYLHAKRGKDAMDAIGILR